MTAGAAALVALAAGCSSSSGSASLSSPAPTTSSGAASAPAGGPATLKAAASPEGQILVDGAGRTLYLFMADTGPKSTCVGSCAIAWPPLTTTGTPQAVGLTAAMVGQSTRADQTVQVNYGGHPLYYFSHDAKAGDVHGQGVTAFGGTWYVVSPSGTAITTAAAAPTTPPSTAPASPSTGSGGYGSGY